MVPVNPDTLSVVNSKNKQFKNIGVDLIASFPIAIENIQNLNSLLQKIQTH